MSNAIINFIYKDKIIKILGNKDEYMISIFQRFLAKLEKKSSDIYFSYNSIILEEDTKLNEIMNENNEILIGVSEESYDDNDIGKEVIIQSKEVICPECGEECIIELDDYKITLSNCINNHYLSNILIKEYIDYQKIDESKILCHNCSKVKSIIYNSQLYKCCTCNIYLCPLCKDKHDKKHLIIDYELKNYLCNKHGERYISYCKKCSNNLCDLCEIGHDKEHNIISHKDILKKDDYMDTLNNLRNKINHLKNDINQLIKRLNKIQDNFELYYNISKDFINTYNIKKKNYQLLMNLNNIICFNHSIIGDIDKIVNEEKIVNKFKYLEEIYKNMEITNEILIKYNAFDEDKIQIFGEKFVENNKDNYEIINNGKSYELSSFINLNEMKVEDNILEIKLREIKMVDDISYMFSKCSSLISLDNITKWNTNNIINMESMFQECVNLSSLPEDISNWNTHRVGNLSGIFESCCSLLSLPDISKWSTNNVTDLSFMFNICSELKSLPNISKWNIINVHDINSLFKSCSSLQELPDISNWNTENVKDIHSLFRNCSSLLILPDISRWNTSNIQNISNLFNGCKKLLEIPDISKWDISHVKNIEYLFKDCESLEQLPDISKWNTSKVENMESIFSNCSSLLSLPNISNWDTSNIINMSGIFELCSSLTELPDISQWNMSNATDISFMFNKCSNIKELPDISNWDINKVINMRRLFQSCS